ncbi:MAG: hypothetical protein DWQ05_22165 [Calditrichaeota bacterium]|nr:MAG: hypothetical protein DWQ05_22165 [Calditrichota bacterium]
MDALWLVNIFWLGIVNAILLIFVLVLAFKIYTRLGQMSAAGGGVAGGSGTKWPPAGDDPIIPPPLPPVGGP